VVAGCGTPDHRRAVVRAQAWADEHRVEGRVTCSSGFKPPSAMSARADFICLVRRSPLDCTVLHVTATVPAEVTLLHRHADCVQPL
jgi:hypothetical protein